MTVRAVIFDWGGTLTPWHLIDHDALWRAVCTPHFPPQRAGETAAAILAAERELWQVTEHSQQSATLAQVFDRAGVTATDEFLASYYQSWEPHTFTDPEALPLLRGLRERGIKVGVLSNTMWPRSAHERVFVRDQVLELIDGAIYSSEIPWAKPHREAFRAAMTAVGEYDPAACVFVGDRPYDDIHGARSAGMRAVLIANSDVPAFDAAVPDAVITGLAEPCRTSTRGPRAATGRPAGRWRRAPDCPVTERPLRLLGDPVLRTPCDPVVRSDDALGRLVTDLLDTVQVPGRAGLAANQIGSSLAVFAYNVDDQLGYVINPRITELGGSQERPEACLSVPGVSAVRQRAAVATVEGVDLGQRAVRVTGTGELARCLQHETDHLRGELFIDGSARLPAEPLCARLRTWLSGPGRHTARLAGPRIGRRRGRGRASAAVRLGDGGHPRAGGPHQVGGRELDLQPAAAAAAEDGRERERGGVDHHGQAPALAQRGDAARHVAGRPLGCGHVGHDRLLPVGRGGEGLEVEVPGHRDHADRQRAVDLGDERLNTRSGATPSASLASRP